VATTIKGERAWNVNVKLPTTFHPVVPKADSMKPTPCLFVQRMHE
jgi:hypothetical protein